MGPGLTAVLERWPVAGRFAISRGSRTEAEVVVVTLAGGRHSGRGEAVPYARYGETVEGVLAAVQAMAEPVARGLTRVELQRAMPTGAARNAIDCALWDFEAKRLGTSAAALAGLAPPGPLVTAFTLSVAAPEEMAARALAAADRPLLKLKFAGAGDAERLAAVRAARPDARLVVDANEGWREAELEPLLAACARAGVELVEQPLPAGRDAALAQVARPVPVCADESVHTSADLDRVAGRYDAVNVKLDKAGGLTGALALVGAARAGGFKVMVGCMVSTSLAMAPAVLAAQGADFVDLDGPLLLARDRVPGLRYEGGVLYPPPPELWG